MKTVTSLSLLAIISFGLSAPRLTAQSDLAPLVPAGALTRGSASDSKNTPTYELSLNWNDNLSNVLTAPIANAGTATMAVLGVQATSGIFISDYPTSIGAGKTDAVSFIYNAAANTDGDTELIRLLTDQGIQEIRVRLTREKVVTLDAKEVQWTVGESPSAKVVTLTVAAGTAKPTKVTAAGNNRAELKAVNSTIWTISITPGSTTRTGKFPVFVEFDKELPGTAVVILANIQPAQ